VEEKFFGGLWQGAKGAEPPVLHKILFASQQLFISQPITKNVSRETIFGQNKNAMLFVVFLQLQRYFPLAFQAVFTFILLLSN